MIIIENSLSPTTLMVSIMAVGYMFSSNGSYRLAAASSPAVGINELEEESSYDLTKSGTYEGGPHPVLNPVGFTKCIPGYLHIQPNSEFDVCIGDVNIIHFPSPLSSKEVSGVTGKVVTTLTTPLLENSLAKMPIPIEDVVVPIIGGRKLHIVSMHNITTFDSQGNKYYTGVEIEFRVEFNETDSISSDDVDHLFAGGQVLGISWPLSTMPQERDS